MKQKAAIFLFLASFLPGAAPAALFNYTPAYDGDESSFLVRGRIRRLFSAGYARTRETERLSPPAWWTSATGGVYQGRTLSCRGMDTGLNLVSAEIRPVKGFSVEFEGADDRFSSGDSYESSWLHAPGQTLSLQNGVTWKNPDHRDYAETRTDLEGATKLYSLNFFARVYRTAPKNLGHGRETAHNLDFFAGYHWYRDRINLSEGDNTLSSDFFAPTPPRGAFSGLNSPGSMVWKGWRLGLREQAAISKRLAAEAKFAFGPRMTYRAEGMRNLGTDPADTSYIDRAYGQLSEFSAALAWKVRYDIRIELGYMGWFYSSRSGARHTIYPGGSSSRTGLDEIKTMRRGWFLGAGWRY